jgi:hypothetical protein
MGVLAGPAAGRLLPDDRGGGSIRSSVAAAMALLPLLVRRGAKSLGEAARGGPAASWRRDFIHAEYEGNGRAAPFWRAPPGSRCNAFSLKNSLQDAIPFFTVTGADRLTPLDAAFYLGSTKKNQNWWWSAHKHVLALDSPATVQGKR